MSKINEQDLNNVNGGLLRNRNYERQLEEKQRKEKEEEERRLWEADHTGKAIGTW